MSVISVARMMCCRTVLPTGLQASMLERGNWIQHPAYGSVTAFPLLPKCTVVVGASMVIRGALLLLCVMTVVVGLLLDVLLLPPSLAVVVTLPLIRRRAMPLTPIWRSAVWEIPPSKKRFA